jgi:hypothetical protein
MFAQAKMIAIGIAAVLLLSAIGGAVWYYKWSQKEIEVLRANNEKLELAVKLNEEAIDSLELDAKKAAKNYTTVNKQYQAARKENNALRIKLSKFDIAYLASKKPGLVEKILNKGTADAERCFEILSGSPLTEAEIAATKKSQSNSFCPAIANPNYEVKP